MKVVVIGGGPGGYVAAIKAALLGADVTLIEKNKVGGTCLNVGCIPTKALLASTEVLDTVNSSRTFGINILGEISADFELINKRKDEIINQTINGIKYLLNKKKVRLIEGFGAIKDRNTIIISKEDRENIEISADKIIIATGSVPVVPKIFQYDGENVITSDEALYLKEVPKKMIIVGGGVIGCEFAQYFSRLRTEITIVEMEEHILPLEDRDIVKYLSNTFKRNGIKIMTGNRVDSVEVKDGAVSCVLGSGEKIEGDKMLVSIGRRPNCEGLGLENIGIKIEKGKIVVDEKMETNIAGIYAIGDVIDSPQLAHVASKEGIVAAENAVGDIKYMDYRAVPRCIYTDPEIAGVGITEDSAKVKGLEYKIGKFSFSGLGKSRVIGKTEGTVKIITDLNDKIIGASITGHHATELLSELTLAVHFGLTASQIGDVIHPHPTLSEALMEAAHDVHKQSVHSF